MKNETKAWLKKAKEDIETARYNLKGKKLNAAVFFAQQAAEKSLKAVQIERLGRFDRIHDLLTLAKSVSAPESVVESCASVNPYYTITRYPDSEDKTDEKTAKSLLKSSRKVLTWAKQTLKQ
ncbi:MAG: HEPN domain-containing protein [Candidatus Aenigmarchaeota archaeon]|nr:HEPN domain-containing protein [Candidatus Aenigmarchaeota archaeon]